MAVTIETSAPTELAAANLTPRGPVHPSPSDWRDQMLYFLLPDRFSDGEVNARPPFDRDNPDEFKADDKAKWLKAGRSFQGGTLKGIQSKLDYLSDFGVTALWIGPVWRQRADLETYHGYGIQNFLDVEPRFGTRQDLRNLVEAAHDKGMYVLLDIIYNHTGNNWFYNSGPPQTTKPYRFEPPYPFDGWRSESGDSVPDIASLDDGIWPKEFQKLEWYTRSGQIGRWDAAPWEDPLHPDTEFRRGDFYDLKDLDLNYPHVLDAVIRVYQYWIALSDCDGFRIDTVKHVSWEASRNFCGAIHEYAESIGKNNFLLIGEVTGGAEMAKRYLEVFGRNIDAVLDIGVPSTKLAGAVKGSIDSDIFFDQFRDHAILGTHRNTGRYHVSILDDHDMVGRRKHRFAAHNTIVDRYAQMAHAVGMQLTTLGIPCVYYGSEQSFDGTQDRQDTTLDKDFEDRFIREAMFGGSFGAFETAGCHFFDPDHPTYLRIAAIARVRNRQDLIGLALRRGRQYPRETSFLAQPFSIPVKGELIAWSRILHRQEVLIALNSHGTELRGADVTVDASLNPPGSAMTVLYRSDWTDAQLKNPPSGETKEVLPIRGRSAVRVDLPPAGMMILG